MKILALTFVAVFANSDDRLARQENNATIFLLDFDKLAYSSPPQGRGKTGRTPEQHVAVNDQSRPRFPKVNVVPLAKVNGNRTVPGESWRHFKMVLHEVLVSETNFFDCSERRYPAQ
ncbi:MAG TPA: hypothetical protein VG146_11845 [Verrucomicrobiae bacterium]|nr:hypothetical protein [Verrucomicrobiae bacterium]